MNVLMAYSLFLQLDQTQPGQAQVPVWGDNWSLFVMVLKMSLTLGAVCLLAFVLLRYGLPRVTGLQAPNGKLMRVVARFPLEAQKSLYVVEVAGKHLLLGVTEQRIDVLSELEPQAVREALDAAAAESGEPSRMARLGSNAVKEFSRYLRR